jgi:hypothetical protein
MDKFIDQTRLAHPSFAHQRHHLSMAGSGALQGLVQRG